MELIEQVSALSEKFYAIDATNYEEDVEKALLGLGFTREDSVSYTHLDVYKRQEPAPLLPALSGR